MCMCILHSLKRAFWDTAGEVVAEFLMHQRRRIRYLIYNTFCGDYLNSNNVFVLRSELIYYSFNWYNYLYR